jgi:threo-3-hydroxy-L-aspartate ammonia-lyase
MTVAAAPGLVSLDDIREAAKALSGIAVNTPLLAADDLAERLGVPVWVKAESLQRVGAFKLRGAFNLVRQLAAGSRGVITYSSGNHGQAVAYAARRFGLRAVIVMPETVTAAKKSGVERLGGEVVLAGRTSRDRYEKAMELAARDGLAVIPPFDHPAIIAGQGTVGVEIAEALPQVGTVLVPIGGGGLSSGVATALHHLAPAAKTIVVEPDGAAKLGRSLAEGRRVTLDKTASIADGLITLSIGELNWEHLRRYAHKAVQVTDAQIVAGVRFALDRLKLVVEPSGAATLGWLMHQPKGSLDGPVVCVLSGGNIDWPGLKEVLA